MEEEQTTTKKPVPLVGTPAEETIPSLGDLGIMGRTWRGNMRPKRYVTLGK